MKTIKNILTLFTLCLLLLGQQAVAGPSRGPCQLQATQELKKWPFEIEYVYKKPEWSADKAGSELLTTQAQYFSGKNSPFMRNKIPSELGFYDARVKLDIVPYVTYTKTIDDRKCAQIVGAKLVVLHTPQIKLASELAERNCVSRAALAQQLKHNDATIVAIKAFMAASEEAKAMIFPTYEKQGAAGKTNQEITAQLGAMKDSAIAALEAELNLKIRLQRLQSVETLDNFRSLYASCDGEFQKASSLAKKEDAHEH